MKPSLRKIVADRVIALRGECDYSQTEFALRANISRSHLKLIERGEVDVGMDTIEKIIDAFGKSPGEFFDG